ncbi:hypothetical protein L0657_23530 [Dyadobacter sp. CY345]|uniref:hypothetical protein n=1 Tax=Dyadobacter sp. CY345 TaxID=2909335 RepID=UPI001F27E482|nr:hypothetical protein [Dyadobacter sp. CY345]MCF2446946.1 hypothetical protein [Dyadobacter sp. CY345]
MNNVLLKITFIVLFLFSFSCKKDSPEPTPIVEVIPPKEIILTDTSMVSIAKGFEALLIQRNIIIDQTNDGLVRYGDIKNIDTIKIETTDFSHYNFTSLKGIEYFPNLIYLGMNGSYVDSVDLSKNPKLHYVNCSGATVGGAGVNMTVKYLDVTNCPDLQYLYCFNNLLESLDVSKNTKLKLLNVSLNRLSNIDISQNTSLEYFNCNYNKQIVNLDFSKNLLLKYVFCADNILSALDVKMLPDLIELDCSENLNENYKTFETLDISQNSKLTYLAIAASRLSKIDLHNNPLIYELDCTGAKNLKTIDLSNLKDLRNLYISRSGLSGIDLSANLKLEIFNMSGTVFKNIDLSANTNLKRFFCYQHEYLTELNLSPCKNLEFCYTFQCPNLKTVCVDKIPDVNDLNWKIDDFLQYKICQ